MGVSGSDGSINVSGYGRSSQRGLFLTVPITILVLATFSVTVVDVALTPKPPRLPPTTPLPTTVGPSTAPPLVKDVRLPSSVRPIHYAVTLAPYIYGTNASAFYFTGSVRIRVHVCIRTKNIKLHAVKINFDHSSLKVFATGKNYSVEQISYDKVRQWFSIDLSETILSTTEITIEIPKFRGPLATDLKGLYLSSFTENNIKKYLATSQLQPADARKVFPCFDEPSFKAKFDISLVRHPKYTALSNMPSKSKASTNATDWFDETKGLSGLVKENFATTPIMSTYILAFIVAQFDSISAKDKQGRTYRNWARPEFVRKSGYMLDAVRNITQFFESYFDVPFPLNKTDQVAVPDFIFTAMENWGLIIYRESRLIFDESMGTTSAYQLTGSVVSHEVAHMWFGNLVTPEWWDDLWLNEGFATFFMHIGVHYLHPDWEIDAQFVSTLQREAFDVDSMGASHPIYVQVYNPDQINEIFDTISYKKGASVLRMLHSFIGDEVFRKGVGNYLKNNMYGNTFHTVLYESLTQQYKKTRNSSLNVSEVMNRWINQMGYPVINCSITRTGSDATLALTQNHFLSDPSQVPKYESIYNYTWIVPITMATKENITSWNSKEVSHLVYWMKTKVQKFYAGKKPTWYLLNLRSSGFYRVNYDQSNWKELANQLITDHTVFTPHDRARLLDDSFALANAGYISYNIPMDLTRYLKNEKHYVPWLSALSKLNYVYSMLHRQSPEYGPFRAYMRTLLAPAFREVGLSSRSVDTHLTMLKREQIVFSACLFGVRECENAAIGMFKNYTASNFKFSLPPNVRYSVLCKGTGNSPVVVWDTLFEQARKISYPSAKMDIIRSLACTSEPRILNRYLDYALDEAKISRKDLIPVFQAVSANPNGLQIVWNYLKRIWDRIQTQFSASSTLSELIKNLADFNTPQQLVELKRFKEEKKDKLGSASKAMDLALENVKVNINWMQRNLPVLKIWLEKQIG